MLEFFTVLIIDYKLQNQAMETRIWFDTANECQVAMDDDVIDPLYNYLLMLYGNDIMARCYVTTEVSHDAVRPRIRPEGFGNG